MNANQDAKKERSQIIGAIIIYVLMLGLLGKNLLQVVLWQRVPHPLGLVMGDLSDQGMVPLKLGSSGAQAMFVGGYVGSMLCLALIATMLTLLARRMLKGEFFTAANAKYFQVAAFSVLMYFVAGFIQRMGANLFASQLNIQAWFEVYDALDLTAVVLFLFMETLVVMAIVSSRGLVLQEDQEGLI